MKVRGWRVFRLDIARYDVQALNGEDVCQARGSFQSETRQIDGKEHLLDCCAVQRHGNGISI